MPKVVVPVKEEILRAAQQHKEMRRGEEISQFLAELIELGFEHRFQQLYLRFGDGEISLGYFAKEMGLSLRDLYAAFEQRGLPTSNIGARPSVEVTD
ncbi:MAG: hypothetical protein AAGB97_08740 [Dehalococcoidia bacterium]|nr:hypothetical protein [Chloroflexota bacterium]MBT9160898.1 hypothetical protein [Chloroflexota bacterium]